jgi:hypothetical protein
MFHNLGMCVLIVLFEEQPEDAERSWKGKVIPNRTRIS